MIFFFWWDWLNFRLWYKQSHSINGFTVASTLRTSKSMLNKSLIPSHLHRYSQSRWMVKHWIVKSKPWIILDWHPYLDISFLHAYNDSPALCLVEIAWKGIKYLSACQKKFIQENDEYSNTRTKWRVLQTIPTKLGKRVNLLLTSKGMHLLGYKLKFKI